MSDSGTDRYWQAVTTLGRLDPADADLERVVAGVDDADTLFDRIVEARVYTLAQRHLERVEPSGGAAADTLTRLQTLAAEEDERRRLARPEMTAVVEAAAKSGDRIIKGLALREWYTDPSVRHEGDVDLHVPDWEHGLALAGWLRGRGWAWDTHEFPWIKWTDGGCLYGQLSLLFPAEGEPFARADVHIGPYSVGHAGLLPLTGWEHGDVLGTPVLVPGPEATFALIAAHAVNDGLLSMKDINDVHMLLANRPAPDWGAVEELCRTFGGVSVLRHLLAAAAEIYPGHVSPFAPGEPVLATDALRGDARAERFATLALRDELRRGTAPEAAARVAMEARRYFAADLTPRVDQEPVTGPVAGERSRDRCWRLLPRTTWDGLGGSDSAGPATSAVAPGGPRSEEEIAAGLRLVRQGSGVVVTFGGEVFVPTVWGGVHPHSLALAAAESEG